MRGIRLFVCLVIFLFSISCYQDVYEVTQRYTVAGDRTTDVTINYSDQDGITTIKIPPEELAWFTNITLQGKEHRHKDWFLSAESDSEGELIVIIGTDRYTSLNTGIEIASNYTTNQRYIFVTLKSAR